MPPRAWFGRAPLLLLLLLLFLPSSASADGVTRFRLRSAKRSLWLHAGAAGALIDLLPELQVAHGRRRWTRRFSIKQLELKAGVLHVVAEARLPTLRCELELLRAAGSPELIVRVRRRYLRRVTVRYERLRFHLAPGVGARGLDPLYRLRAVGRGLLSGVEGPAVALLSRGGARVAWLGEATTQTARLSTIGPRSRRLVLDVELDHAGNHPLRAFRRCARFLRRLPPANRVLDAAPRRAGEVVLAAGRFLLAPRAIGVPERYPRGFRAALVMTDHADQSSADKLEAFAFGETGALAKGALGPEHPGFVNRGLRYTKSIFLARARRYARQFDHPRYRRLLGALEARGVEIGVHSATGGRDTPARTRALLAAFRRVHKGRTWIDHQPYTNCEALSMHGLERRSRWYVLGALAQTGIRYVWAVPDVFLQRGSLNMLRGRAGRPRRPAIFAHPRLRAGKHAFIAFRSVNLFSPWRRFSRRFTRRALDALEREAGLLIGHVYLDTARASGRFRRFGLLTRRRRGGYRLRPEVDALFRRLAARQKKRTLWVAGIEAVGDHLLAALALSRQHTRDGALALQSRSKLALRDITLRVWPLASQVVAGLRIDGKALAVSREGAFLRTVIPGDFRRVRRLAMVGADGKALPFAGKVALELSL